MLFFLAQLLQASYYTSCYVHYSPSSISFYTFTHSCVKELQMNYIVNEQLEY